MTADYVPTQVLADLYRHNGYDGIPYKSLLGPGYNYALFDLDSADLLNCCLYKVENIQFAFRQDGNPYYSHMSDRGTSGRS
jgi:RES domain-containing protein